jgi:hypothetical protein
MGLQPFLYLKCPDCFAHMPFPNASPLGRSGHRNPMPTETWKAFVLCGYCKRVNLYESKDVQIARPHNWQLEVRLPSGIGASPSFFRVEHRCGHDNCESRHVLYVAIWRYQTERALVTLAKEATPNTVCGNGHEFAPSFELVNVREVFALS